MNLAEYARHDALALADLVARKQVTPKELAALAAKAVAAVNKDVNAVVELYGDRIDGLDEASLGSGPFRGVPFLIKDVYGHEAGRTLQRSPGHSRIVEHAGGGVTVRDRRRFRRNNAHISALLAQRHQMRMILFSSTRVAPADR